MSSENPQWGRQQQSGADQVLEQMAADTGGQLERDSLGRLVLIRPLTAPAPSR